jgi:hypothetical protein
MLMLESRDPDDAMSKTGVIKVHHVSIGGTPVVRIRELEHNISSAWNVSIGVSEGIKLLDELYHEFDYPLSNTNVIIEAKETDPEFLAYEDFKRKGSPGFYQDLGVRYAGLILKSGDCPDFLLAYDGREAIASVRITSRFNVALIVARYAHFMSPSTMFFTQPELFSQLQKVYGRLPPLPAGDG